MRNTKEKKMNFLMAFQKKAGNITELCKLVDIQRKTFYDWMKKDKRFNRCICESEEGVKDFVESKLLEGINRVNPQLIMFYARTKMKDRGYADKQEIQHSGFEDIKINFSIPYGKEVIDVTPEDGKKRIEHNDQTDPETS